MLLPRPGAGSLQCDEIEIVVSVQVSMQFQTFLQNHKNELKKETFLFPRL